MQVANRRRYVVDPSDVLFSHRVRWSLTLFHSRPQLVSDRSVEAPHVHHDDSTAIADALYQFCNVRVGNARVVLWRWEFVIGVIRRDHVASHNRTIHEAKYAQFMGDGRVIISITRSCTPGCEAPLQFSLRQLRHDFMGKYAAVH